MAYNEALWAANIDSQAVKESTTNRNSTEENTWKFVPFGGLNVEKDNSVVKNKLHAIQIGGSSPSAEPAPVYLVPNLNNKFSVSNLKNEFDPSEAVSHFVNTPTSMPNQLVDITVPCITNPISNVTCVETVPSVAVYTSSPTPVRQINYTKCGTPVQIISSTRSLCAIRHKGNFYVAKPSYETVNKGLIVDRQKAICLEPNTPPPCSSSFSTQNEQVFSKASTLANKSIATADIKLKESPFQPTIVDVRSLSSASVPISNALSTPTYSVPATKQLMTTTQVDRLHPANKQAFATNLSVKSQANSIKIVSPTAATSSNSKKARVGKVIYISRSNLTDPTVQRTTAYAVKIPNSVATHKRANLQTSLDSNSVKEQRIKPTSKPIYVHSEAEIKNRQTQSYFGTSVSHSTNTKGVETGFLEKPKPFNTSITSPKDATSSCNLPVINIENDRVTLPLVASRSAPFPNVKEESLYNSTQDNLTKLVGSLKNDKTKPQKALSIVDIDKKSEYEKILFQENSRQRNKRKSEEAIQTYGQEQVKRHKQISVAPTYGIPNPTNSGHIYLDEVKDTAQQRYKKFSYKGSVYLIPAEAGIPTTADIPTNVHVPTTNEIPTNAPIPKMAVIPKEKVHKSKAIDKVGKNSKVYTELIEKLNQCKSCYVVLNRCYSYSNSFRLKTRKAKIISCQEKCKVDFLKRYIKRNGDKFAPQNVLKSLNCIIQDKPGERCIASGDPCTIPTSSPSVDSHVINCDSSCGRETFDGIVPTVEKQPLCPKRTHPHVNQIRSNMLETMDQQSVTNSQQAGSLFSIFSPNAIKENCDVLNEYAENSSRMLKIQVSKLNDGTIVLKPVPAESQETVKKVSKQNSGSCSPDFIPTSLHCASKETLAAKPCANLPVDKSVLETVRHMLKAKTTKAQLELADMQANPTVLQENISLSKLEPTDQNIIVLKSGNPVIEKASQANAIFPAKQGVMLANNIPSSVKIISSQNSPFESSAKPIASQAARVNENKCMTVKPVTFQARVPTSENADVKKNRSHVVTLATMRAVEREVVKNVSSQQVNRETLLSVSKMLQDRSSMPKVSCASNQRVKSKKKKLKAVSTALEARSRISKTSSNSNQQVNNETLKADLNVFKAGSNISNVESASNQVNREILKIDSKVVEARSNISKVSSSKYQRVNRETLQAFFKVLEARSRMPKTSSAKYHHVDWETLKAVSNIMKSTETGSDYSKVIRTLETDRNIFQTSSSGVPSKVVQNVNMYKCTKLPGSPSQCSRVETSTSLKFNTSTKKVDSKLDQEDLETCHKPASSSHQISNVSTVVFDHSSQGKLIISQAKINAPTTITSCSPAHQLSNVSTVVLDHSSQGKLIISQAKINAPTSIISCSSAKQLSNVSTIAIDHSSLEKLIISQAKLKAPITIISCSHGTKTGKRHTQSSLGYTYVPTTISSSKETLSDVGIAQTRRGYTYVPTTISSSKETLSDVGIAQTRRGYADLPYVLAGNRRNNNLRTVSPVKVHSSSIHQSPIVVHSSVLSSCSANSLQSPVDPVAISTCDLKSVSTASSSLEPTSTHLVRVKPEPVSLGYGEEERPVVSIKSEPVNRGYSDELLSEPNKLTKATKRKFIGEEESEFKRLKTVTDSCELKNSEYFQESDSHPMIKREEPSKLQVFENEVNKLDYLREQLKEKLLDLQKIG